MTRAHSSNVCGANIKIHTEYIGPVGQILSGKVAAIGLVGAFTQ